MVRGPRRLHLRYSCRHANRRYRSPPLCRWLCLRRLGCQNGFDVDPRVSIRVFSQVDSVSFPSFCCHARRRPQSLTRAITRQWCRRLRLITGDCICLLLAAVINNAMKDKNSQTSWRIPIGVQFIWGFILAVGMIFLPESPQWLIKKERNDGAARALSRLVSLPLEYPEIWAELDETRVSFQREKELGKSYYLSCFRATDNKILLCTLTGIFIQAWQQLTGINFILYTVPCSSRILASVTSS